MGLEKTDAVKSVEGVLVGDLERFFCAFLGITRSSNIGGKQTFMDLETCPSEDDRLAVIST